MRVRTLAPVLIVASLVLGAAPGRAGETWRQPPPPVLDVLHAPDFPSTWPDPTGRTIALVERLRYPPIAELAAPMLRLAGVRVNPATNTLHAENAFTSLTLQRLADGRQLRIELPEDARMLRFSWSPDGSRFAFAHRAGHGAELFTGVTETGATRRIEGVHLNPMLGDPISWMPDGRLLVTRVPADRGAAPQAPARPEGPNVSESSGGRATSTYEARDVLATAHDEALFEHFATAGLALVDPESGAVVNLAHRGLIASASPSPDGKHVLVETIRKPFSRRHAWWRFPRDVEVHDLAGAVVTLARLPLADAVPIHGVPEGPRQHAWRSTAPATVTWIEALDGGDWSRQVPHRDRVLALAAPFEGEPAEIYRATHRARGLSWGDTDDLLVVEEYERERRWRHVTALHPDTEGAAPVKLFDLSANDGYADPGSPVMRALPSGHAAIRQVPGGFFMAGQGASPEGDRPFLDTFDVTTRVSARAWRSERNAYERFLGFAENDTTRLLVRAESASRPPNVVELRRAGSRRVAAGEAATRWTARAVTSFPDPAPIMRGVKKQLVTFARADGTPLSFTLMTPPGWKGGPLPTIVYAYPLEYSDPATAGQVSGTEHSFTRPAGASHLFLLLSGYAILHDTNMPVVGHPDTAYDTFIEQLVASAEAAVAKAVEMGVTDPDRVGVMGHSHGGLMTATLLAHSDIFRAGIARSGAYNHTMRPFGFQSERRTLWQAMDNYVRLSPVMHAPKINEPILIIHGEVDQNPGTVPLQSEKLYDAIRGTGGTARLLMLPHEMHGYSSREAVEHVLAEQVAWFDRHVRDAAPRAVAKSEAQAATQ